MSYIKDAEDVRNEIEEIMDYINNCSERQADDTKAFLEILRLCQDDKVGAFEACVKIAGICEERLNQ